MNTLLLIFALIPIVWLVVALGVLKMPGHIACSIGLGVTVVLSLIAGGSAGAGNVTPLDTFTGALEGIVMGMWPIVYIIIAAVFTYNLTVYSGSMEKIKTMMTGVSSDKRILVLILAWGFGGFLEAIAGFGTAVAIPAGIMAALGFNPIAAAVMCLIANTTPTAFGAIGLPVITLAQVSKLDVMHLSFTVSIQLFLLILIIPFILVSLAGGKGLKSIKGVFGITLLSGLAFALPQVFVSKFLGAELPAIIGSLVCLGVTVLVAKKFYSKGETADPANQISLKEGVRAWLPFIFVFLLVMLCSALVPPVNHALSLVKTSVPIYTGHGAKPYTFSWISTPGTLIIIATILGGLCQGLKIGEIMTILGKTAKQMVKTLITVCSIVGLAKVMGYSGMTLAIATALVAATGSFYPLIAPIIGALGTFITGSDTSSNVLFGQLQVEAAKGIGANPFWIAAANMAGATAGKMISPQSIAVATSATGLVGEEGKILTSAMKYCAGYVVIIGIVVYFFGPMIIAAFGL